MKPVLANILIGTIEEFADMEVSEVIPLIEGEPIIGTTPVDPGMSNESNKDGKVIIRGMSTEDNVLNEGVRLYDVLFYVNAPNGRTQIIVNVEAQKKEPSEYDIERRGIFYTARQISAQLDREFVGQDYNSIKKVYSIWLVMSCKENALEKLYFTSNNIFGERKWNSSFELQNIIIARLKDENIADKSKKYKLHRFLWTLFMSNYSKNKMRSALKEFGIEDSDGKEIEDNMCNLGEGVYERGIEHGIEKGQHKLASLFIKMDADGRIDEYRDAVINEDLLKKLLSEYGLD